MSGVADASGGRGDADGGGGDEGVGGALRGASRRREHEWLLPFFELDFWG